MELLGLPVVQLQMPLPFVAAATVSFSPGIPTRLSVEAIEENGEYNASLRDGIKLTERLGTCGRNRLAKLPGGALDDLNPPEKLHFKE